MNKFVATLALLILVLCGTAYAGPFGPAETTAQPGKLAFGVGYFRYSENLKPSDDSFLTVADFWQKTRVTQNQVFGQVNFGLMKGWEAYGRLGAADFRARDAFDFGTSSDDAQDGMQVFGTLGVKGVLFSAGPFSIGPFVQGSYYSGHSDSMDGTIGGSPVNLSYKTKDSWDAYAGVTVQMSLGKASLYAGPFVYMKRMKVELQIVSPGTDKSDSTTLREDNNFGGFAGVSFPLTDKISVGVEGQYTNRPSAGAMLSYKF